MENVMMTERLPGLDLNRLANNLNGQYIRCLDNDRLEEWPEFFVENGRYRVHPRDNRESGLEGGHWMYYASRGMMHDRVTSLRHINKYNKRYYRHMIGDTLVTSVKDDIIFASTNYFLAHTNYEGHTSLFNVGEYLDQIVLVDGQPKFLEKLVIPDTFHSHAAVVMPI